MKPMRKRYHIVHDSEGRILAMMPVVAAELKDGIRMGWRPLAGAGQFVAEVQLTATHARMNLQELLDHFLVRLDAKAGTVTLRRRTIRT
ncbi:MAG: hypothetical protein R3B37_13905 [Nitrospira sp.]|nr:hypothetical protein [Nitrospira sp.]